MYAGKKFRFRKHCRVLQWAELFLCWGAPLFIHLAFLKFINQLFLQWFTATAKIQWSIILVTDTLSNGLFDVGRHLVLPAMD